MRGKRVALQVANGYLSEILLYWLEFGKPCQLSISGAKTSEDICGVCFNIDNRDTEDFMQMAVARTKARVHIIPRK